MKVKKIYLLFFLIFIINSSSSLDVASSDKCELESGGICIQDIESAGGGGTTNNYYNITGGNISGDGTAGQLCRFKSQNIIESFANTFSLYDIEVESGGNELAYFKTYNTLSSSPYSFYNTTSKGLHLKTATEDNSKLIYIDCQDTIGEDCFYITDAGDGYLFSNLKVNTINASIYYNLPLQNLSNINVSGLSDGDILVYQEDLDEWLSYFYEPGNRSFNQTLTDSLYVPDSNNGVTTIQAGQLVVNINSTNDASITFSTYDLFGDGSILIPKITPYTNSFGAKFGYIESGLYMLSTDALVAPSLTFQNDITAKSGSLSLSSDGRLVIDTFTNVTSYIPIYASNFGGEGHKLTNLTAYNSTYARWAYNQTCLGKTLFNTTFCTSDRTTAPLNCLITGTAGGQLDVTATGYTNGTTSRVFQRLYINNVIKDEGAHERAANANPTPFSLQFVNTSIEATIYNATVLTTGGTMNFVKIKMEVFKSC